MEGKIKGEDINDGDESVKLVMESSQGLNCKRWRSGGSESPRRAIYNVRLFSILMLLLCVASFLSGNASAYNGVQNITFSQSFSQSDLIFSEYEKYDVVKLMDCYTTTEETGKPMLPVKIINLIIPVQNTVDEISFFALESETLPDTYNIYPKQPDYPLDSPPPPWVEPDPSTYNQTTPYPGKFAEVVHEGYFNGNKIVMIKLYPLQWTPATGKLQLYTTIGLELTLVASGEEVLRPQKMSKASYRVYKPALISLVANKGDIATYGYEPIIAPDAPPPPDIMEPLPAQPTKDGDVVDYLIITQENLANSFTPLVNWLWAKGWRTRVIHVDDIISTYPGVDDAEKIRNCIKTWWLYCGLPWVLLGGDDESAPGANDGVRFRHGWVYDNNDGIDNVIPTDLYFSDLTGDWDVDGDNRWGEPSDDNPDIYPEVYVGRVLPKTSQEGFQTESWTTDCEKEVSNWITKMLNYEQNPGNALLMKDVVWSCQGWLSDEAQEASSHYPSSFTHRWHTDQTASATINDLNAGYGWACIYAHGSYVEWNTDGETIVSYPSSFWDANLGQLTNENKYFIVYSISCDNAAFDKVLQDAGDYPVKEMTIADGFVDAYPIDTHSSQPAYTYGHRGAAAFLGNTRYGWAYSSKNLHCAFLDVLFGTDEFATRLGYAEGMSKTLLSDRYVQYSHNLLGSPETLAWTAVPKPLVVNHPRCISVKPDYCPIISVKTTGGTPVPDARVCLWKGDEVFEVGYTDMQGEWSSCLYPRTTGNMYVTVTKQNYIPYQGSIYVYEHEWTDPNGVTWSNPIRITDNPNIDDRPSIIETPSYGPLQVFTKWILWHSDISGGPNIFYKTSADLDGASWSAAEQLTTVGANYRPATAIVRDSSSYSLWVTWGSQGPGSDGSDIYYNYFAEISPFEWGWQPSDIRLNPTGWDFSGSDRDPSIIQTSDGAIWIAWCSDVDGDYDIYLTKSEDGGNTWQSTPGMHLNLPGDEMYPSMVQVDDQRIWIVFQTGGEIGDEICSAFYDVLVDAFSIGPQLTSNSVPDAHPTSWRKQNGNIWVVWDRFEGGDSELYYTICDPTMTCTPEVKITNCPTAFDQAPWITQTHDERVWVTWATNRDGNFEIYAMYAVGPGKARFVASFMTPEGDPYPFDVIISDGEWREEFKNVTYIETEVPTDFTITYEYQRGVLPAGRRWMLSFSPGEVRRYEFYALDVAQLEARTRPYISWQEEGANAELTWGWNSSNDSLSWIISKEQGKMAGVTVMIDDNIQESPNYVISASNSDECEQGTCPTQDFHRYPAPCDALCPANCVFMEISSDWGAVRVGYALYNDAILTYPVTTRLCNVDGTKYDPEYFDPQYAVPAGNYILSIEDIPEGYALLDFTLNVKAGNEIRLYDIHSPKIVDLEPFTFSIAAEDFWANSSYYCLKHDAEAYTLTVNVSTEMDYDWWGYLVLPDNFTVAAARSYDGLGWSDLDELYDYIINPVDGYKIVVVKITPETEKLLLKYSPVSIPVIAFYPPEVDILLDSTKTVNLTLSSAPNGLSGYNLTASLSNSSVAEILSVNFPDWATLYDNSMLPSDSVWIKATDLNDRIKRGESNITLATLIIRGDKQGKSDIFINATKIDDDDGNPIYPIITSGQVDVVPSCGIIFPSCANPPTDPDNDGLCEDTNGNVRKDFYDVIVFFKNLEWVEKNQPIECYDFNKNGHIDFNDIVKLFGEI